ncbi:hypothetical protein K474DRAFT_575579 [Panus rudis PR-1116 ss-1]|nr:hypothetical protein K474DRAFT_575579 [Panus rudis PR-1116 ss-1]
MYMASLRVILLGNTSRHMIRKYEHIRWKVLKGKLVSQNALVSLKHGHRTKAVGHLTVFPPKFLMAPLLMLDFGAASNVCRCPDWLQCNLTMGWLLHSENPIASIAGSVCRAVSGSVELKGSTTDAHGDILSVEITSLTTSDHQLLLKTHHPTLRANMTTDQNIRHNDDSFACHIFQFTYIGFSQITFNWCAHLTYKKLSEPITHSSTKERSTRTSISQSAWYYRSSAPLH